MKNNMIKRKIVNINENICNGCGNCIPKCAEGALQIVNGKAKIIKETYCDGLGACLGQCPQGAITITEREADAFNEAEVHEHLKTNIAIQTTTPQIKQSLQKPQFQSKHPSLKTATYSSQPTVHLLPSKTSTNSSLENE
jgi:ferredoxin